MNTKELFRNYISKEKKYLFYITITGIIYNIGLTAGPYFEGQLAQCLADIYRGIASQNKMIMLALIYVIVIFVVQASRFLKRLYVRKFGNAINRNLKMDVYRHFLDHTGNENEGSMMTKAISDVDACSEGVRKFTTEIFDTGIALIAYLVMLAVYDLKLTIVCALFQCIAYFIADRLGPIVAKNASYAKQSAEVLNANTLDRLHLALTYRIYGQERNMQENYETCLNDYEEKTIRSNIYETALRPLYQVISMLGVILIFVYGSQNVQNGIWNVASFTAYLSCFTKMAVKSSHAAKLFNAVQKAKVSWARIEPLLKTGTGKKERKQFPAETLQVKDLHFQYGDHCIFSDVNFQCHKGEIVGITGEIASGKSTLGKMFLEGSNYQGSILVDGKELRDLEKEYAVVSYMGHQYELFDDSLKNNIQLGKEGDIQKVLECVCMKDEVRSFPEKENTTLGENGVKLSGGQQARTALARTLYHARSILVLDDPFSACDQTTESEILQHLRIQYSDSIIFIISHRLRIFKDLDQVLFLNEGKVQAASHQYLMEHDEKYHQLYTIQTKEEL